MTLSRKKHKFLPDNKNKRKICCVFKIYIVPNMVIIAN